MNGSRALKREALGELLHHGRTPTARRQLAMNAEEGSRLTGAAP